MKQLPILCLLLLGLLAAPAAADSLVYTKDGNVWAAGADGSDQVRLTRDGSSTTPYGTPSQADDGTVLAVRGSRFVKLDRSGRQTGTFGSVLTDKPDIINAYGPWDAKLSPDGSKVAYWLGIVGGWKDYSDGTYYVDPQSAVVYQSAADGRQLGSTMFYEQPSWTGDSQHLLLFDELNGGVPQVVRAGVGANHNDAQGWFHDLDTFAPGPEGWHPIGAGELSRDGSKLALLRAPTNAGNGGSARGTGNRVTLYTVGGFDRVPQAMVCGFTEDHGGELGPPTWSPDGRQVAWAAPDGIHVGTLGEPGSCNGWSEKLVIAGGNEPDWGPAAPGPGVQGGGGQDVKAGAIAVRSRARISRAALRRRGLIVRVTCPSACRVDAKLRLRKRVIGKAKARRASAGEAKLRVRSRRAVRRGAKLRLTVKVRPGGTITRAVRVR